MGRLGAFVFTTNTPRRRATVRGPIGGLSAARGDCLLFVRFTSKSSITSNHHPSQQSHLSMFHHPFPDHLHAILGLVDKFHASTSFTEQRSTSPPSLSLYGVLMYSVSIYPVPWSKQRDVYHITHCRPGSSRDGLTSLTGLVQLIYY